MACIKVFENETIGPIRKVNGVGQPPITGAANSDMFHFLTEANIPYSRLHDAGGTFGGGRFVDIPIVFPRFEADENDPASYEFAYTDWLLSELDHAGVEPVYRLGVTIENAAEMHATERIHPPKDYEKWARICEHVIRHYTEGWANGFNFHIDYWEIWGEPDGHYIPKYAQLWQGTAEEYYRLYEVAARHLKACFPHLKIGGYGSCGFYAITAQAPNERQQYFITFFEDFLKWIKSDEHKAPIDFFSWHSYSGIEDVQKQAEYCRSVLDQYGFTHVETQLNEWNPGPRPFGSLKHAADVGGMLCALQDLPVDTAMFYDARIGISEYGSLFNPATREPYAEYDAFVMFGRLLRLGQQVRTELEDGNGLYAVAATNGKKHGMMIVNTSEKAKLLTVEGIDLDEARCTVTDEKHRMDMPDIVRGNGLAITPYSLTWLAW